MKASDQVEYYCYWFEDRSIREAAGFTTSVCTVHTYLMKLVKTRSVCFSKQSMLLRDVVGTD